MSITNFGNPCAVCGEKEPDLFRIWFDGYVKLFRCKRCGFIAQFPGPGRCTILTDYEDEYTLDFLDQGHEFMYPYRRRIFKDSLKQISNYYKEGKILDVGCGDGHFLYLCAQQGYDCYGVEDSKALSAYASRKTGSKIIQGLYNKDMFPQSSFDIITFIQVIEHIPDPISVLETAFFHLRKNGVILIEVPSVNAPPFLLYRWTTMKRFVKPPKGVIYSHFGYYNPKSLNTLTETCGFNKIKIITGRWQHKYMGFIGQLGKLIDPVLNYLKIGGILYIGKKNQ